MGLDIRALGLDFGSTTAKIVGVDGQNNLVWHHLEQARPRAEDQVEELLARARIASCKSMPLPLVATGYGRGLVYQTTHKITEITCHARGIYQQMGHGGTLIDIGGQDSKVILINPNGEVVDFAMSDKCAAGTGRFLENTAHRLDVPLGKMGQMAWEARQETPISSTCTVFAESEVISLIAHGKPLDAILRGLHRALIKRIAAMLYATGLAPPLMLSGGVAWNQAIRCMLEEEFKTKVVLPRYPQLTGAYGAALIALGSAPPNHFGA
jgi:(R)-2-hydroxyacyl-CoA dehydratese activating ATPase